MKFEQELVKDKATERLEVVEQRRLMRVLAGAMGDELCANNLEELRVRASDVVLCAASILNQREQIPEVEHFIAAAIALNAEATKRLDAALLVQDDALIAIGCVMMELTVRGMFHALGQDYEAALRARVTE